MCAKKSKWSANDTIGLFPAAAKKKPFQIFKNNWELLSLCIPALICYIMFQYMPIGGLILAFKNFRYNLGLFGSPWAGFDNFKYLFNSIDLVRIVRNTIGYNVVFMVIGVITNVIFALLLFEINNRFALKAYQTVITFPNFLSWVMVGYITYAIFNPLYGVFNHFLNFIGLDSVDVYVKAKYWPFILVFVERWKGIGIGCIIYYASLVGLDHSLFEAAMIDGASKWKQTIYISIPSLIPLITIMTIMAIGRVFSGDFGLFYQIPRNVGVIYSATDIIDTYVYRGLERGEFGITSAVGLVQSVVGLVMVFAANLAVKKISPENAMF